LKRETRFLRTTKQQTTNNKQHTNEKGELKMKKLINFFKDEEGATAVEYGIMVAAIAAVIVGVVYTLGENVKTGFDTVNTEMTK
jgi:pilus assembly protein Flp/PilA